MKVIAKVKSFIQAIANSMGYKIIRISSNNTEQQLDMQSPTVGEYTYYYPWYNTYSPWWEDWFQKVVSNIKGITLVTIDRCYIVYALSLNCIHISGDFAECGVYKGGTAFLIASVMEKFPDEKQLHLFDTFSGIPNTAVDGIDNHKAGDFKDVSLNSVKRYLSRFPFLAFHPGFIPNTLEEVKEKCFSFVHVDVDIYQSVRDCCEFFYPRLAKGGVMVFDDYGFPQCKGARQAVDEFFADKRETQITLPGGQCLIIKL